MPSGAVYSLLWQMRHCSMTGYVRDPGGMARPCAVVEWQRWQRNPASMRCSWFTMMPPLLMFLNRFSLVWQRRHDWLSTKPRMGFS